MFVRSLIVVFAAGCSLCGQQRIAQVESGLTPRLRIEGEAPVRWSVGERQKHHRVPAVSVAVVNDGRIEWAKGYGDGITAETRFQAASISKPVAAVAALRMVARGDLRLDEDVNAKLKSWKVGANQWGKPITLRQLLSHTAGLTVHGFPGYPKGAPLPSLVQILNGEKPANTAAVVCNAEPGSIYRYSGGGYQVLQLLIEDVAGKPFAEVVKELVLEPVGMKYSGYSPPRESEVALAFNGKGEPVTGGWHVYPEQAAAGLWTTPSDLARFLLAVRSSKVLPEALTKEMLTPVKDGYALGFGIEGSGESESFGHGGSNAGYRCNASFYRNGRQGVVVMTNGDSGAAIAGELIRSVAEAYSWPSRGAVAFKPAAITEAQLSSLAGEYADGGLRARVSVAGRRLQVAAMGQTFELVPESAVRFAPVTDGAPPFVFEADGSALRAGGRTLKRVSQAQGGGALRGRWSGHIDLPDQSLRVEIDIDRAGSGWAGSITIPAQNSSGIPLEAFTVSQGKASFRIKGVPGEATFHGKLNGEELSGEFTQGGASFAFKLTRTGEPKLEVARKSPAVAKEFVGTWEGVLDVRQGTLRLLLRIVNGDEGASATMVSVDQGNAEIGVSSIEQKGSALVLEVKQVGGAYKAEINKEGTELNGTWTQGGRDLPLKLTKK